MNPEGTGDAEDPAARMEAAFLAIAGGAMLDMPINNPALRVEAVGFRRCERHWVGVLITPWTINLVLLPRAEEPANVTGDAEARHFRFPSGLYEFNAGWLDHIGPYRSCSLFSPPAEFPDQDSARAIAREIMAALFRPGAEVESVPAAVSRRAFLTGRYRNPSNAGAASGA